jgi:DNA-binding NarL/FixJ family response regulator
VIVASAAQGKRMAAQTPKARVLVLYVHPLLGEGLASLLSAQEGVGAVAVNSHDEAARAAALSSRPDLVIVEETESTRPFEPSGSLPVVFVRVDTDAGCRLGQPLDDPDAIVALARGLVDAARTGA